MRINKRELLKKLIQENLWKRLSSEEIRLKGIMENLPLS